MIGPDPANPISCAQLELTNAIPSRALRALVANERQVFDEQQLSQMTGLAKLGIQQLIAKQQAMLGMPAKTVPWS